VRLNKRVFSLPRSHSGPMPKNCWTNARRHVLSSFTCSLRCLLTVARTKREGGSRYDVIPVRVSTGTAMRTGKRISGIPCWLFDFGDAVVDVGGWASVWDNSKGLFSIKLGQWTLGRA